MAATGALWASGMGASLAYPRTGPPLKPSLRLIHARYFTISSLHGLNYHVLILDEVNPFTCKILKYTSVLLWQGCIHKP